MCKILSIFVCAKWTEAEKASAGSERGGEKSWNKSSTARKAKDHGFSVHLTSWEIDGKQVDTNSDLFWGIKLKDI